MARLKIIEKEKNVRKAIVFLVALFVALTYYYWGSISEPVGDFFAKYGVWIFVGVPVLMCIGFMAWALSVLAHQPTRGGAVSNQPDRELHVSKKRKRVAKTIIVVVCILTLGSGYVLLVCMRLILNELAKQNLLVTFRTEGEHKAIMRGETCIRYVSRVENHRIDPDGFDVFKGSFESYASYLARAREFRLKEDPAFVERKLKVDATSTPIVDRNGYYQLNEKLKYEIECANSPSVFEEIFGVAWVGVQPYNVFGYRFRWLQYGQEKTKDGQQPSDKVGVFARDEQVYSLFHRYPRYAITIKNLEVSAGEHLKRLMTDENGKLVKDKVRVSITLVFETITKNPQKTLFRTAALSSAGDWLQTINREISDRFTAWLGTVSWDTLTEDKTVVDSVLESIRKEINGTDENGLPIPRAAISSVRDYGQEIIRIAMVERDLQDTSLQTAQEDVFKAEQASRRDKKSAEGIQALAAAKILGKADGLREIAAIKDGAGTKMFVAEQIGKIGILSVGTGGSLLQVPESIVDQAHKRAKQEEGPQDPEN